MRAQRILYIAIVFFLASIFSSCSESTSPSAPAEIMPLREGSRWIYSISQFDSVHTLRWTLLDTIEIGAPTIHDGKTWYPYLSISFRLSSLDDTLFYRNETDGLWMMFLRSLGSKPYLAYKYPATVGDTFSVISYPTQRSFTHVASINEVVNTPLGAFNCIRYDSHFQLLDSATMNVVKDYIDQDYVSPGIGLIKSIRPNTSLSITPKKDTIIHRHVQETILVSYRF